MRRLLSFVLLLASAFLGLKAQDYTVGLSENPAESGTTTGEGIYPSGTNVTVTATPAVGFLFVNWTENSSEVSTLASYTFEITANRSLVANFSLLQYTITASANPPEGGTVAGAGDYSHGATVTLTASPNAGFAFLNWTEGSDIVSTEASYSFTAGSARTLQANFVRRYTVNLISDPTAGGTTTGGGAFNAGTIATVQATPNTGYTFKEWKSGGTTMSAENPYTFTVNSDINLTASFEPNEYQINATASPLAGGSITGAGNYQHGTTVNLTAVPASGYSFVNWTEGGTTVSTNSTYTFTAVSNRALVANFSMATYTVSTSVNPTSGGTASGGGTFNSGSSVTVTATPSSGYQFVNWSESGSSVSTNSTYTFSITSNRTLVANFSLVSYTVSTSSLPSGGGTTSGGGSYNYGESATVTATPSTGYQFVNWTVGGSPVSTSASYTFTVTANRSLVANFSTLSYTISTSTSPAGVGSTTGSGTYNFGASATVTAGAATGYRFVNWTEGGSVVSTSASYTFTVNSNRNLLANYTLNTYTISTSSSPSTGGSTTGGGTYTHGSQATVTATPSAGYLFVNWTEGGNPVSSNVSYSFTVTGNRTLVANYSLITYTVTTSSSPAAGGTTSGGGTFSPSATVTVTATPASGYQFAGWTEGGTTVSTNSSYSFVISANRNLVATFQSITYLTVNTLSNPSEGGTTSGSGTYSTGTIVTVRATEATGYNFVNWSEGGSTVSTSESYTFTLSSNRTLVANFSQNSYNITTSSSPVSGGTTSGGGSYNYGDEATVTAVAGSGYTFVNWTQGGSVVSSSTSHSFTVTASATLVANFSQITYTVSLSSAPASGGTTSGAGTYGSGTTATVTATPATGYRFVNWTQAGSSVSTDPSYSFPVSGNRTLVANFAVADYTITTSVSPAGTGTVSGGGSFNHGASVTVRAVPASGYQFINWTEGGSSVSTNANYTFTATGNRNLLANFSQIPKLLTLTGPSGTALQNNAVISLENPEEGSFFITVNANAEWTVAENSLWFNAVKENDTRIRVNYLENISVVDKEDPLKVTTALDAEMQLIIKQEARISKINASKLGDIALYPNPAGDKAVLRFAEANKGKIRISISTIQGTIFKISEYEDIQADQIIELDLTGIRSGPYLMHISGRTDKKTFRLIKL